MEREEGRKRRREEGEEEVMVKKRGSSGSEECDEVRAEFVCSCDSIFFFHTQNVLVLQS